MNAVKKKIDEVKARAEEFQKEREAQGMGGERVLGWGTHVPQFV